MQNSSPYAALLKQGLSIGLSLMTWAALWKPPGVTQFQWLRKEG